MVALVESSRANLESGRLPEATASLERALRIEPKNALLWRELAQAHLRQGNYRQAENFAARSNSWAGRDRVLVAANWRLIGEARAARGDEAAAQEARDRAMAME